MKKIENEKIKFCDTCPISYICTYNNMVKCTADILDGLSGIITEQIELLKNNKPM